MVQWYALGAEFLSSSIFHNRQTQASSIQLESLRRYFVGYALKAESGWTGDILLAEVEEMTENSVPEVHVRRFTEKEVRTGFTSSS